MPAQPRAASPGKKTGGKDTKRDELGGVPAEESDTARKKKVAPKRASSARKKEKGGDENAVENDGLSREVDRVRVFLKISSDSNSSVSSCVTCDSKQQTAWALDFDGQRSGQVVTLDGVYGADAPEQSIYPDVVNNLVNEFMTRARGVGCLLVYGQAEAGKETIMYGEAGSRINMTPRTLPAPGHAPQQKAPGLVLSAFRTAIGMLPQIAEQVSTTGKS